MLSKRLMCCAVIMAFGTAAAAATKPAAKPAAKAATAKPAGPQRLKGKTETLACRLGTEDRHARIAVVLIGGKTDSFAYYSKWKPRTCSIYLQRWRDSFSKWADNGAVTTVDLERGAFLIEHKKGEYHFIFRDIDRERYCGMDGVINGSLTIRKGSEQCVLDGEIMVEGTPLGQAFVNREEDKPPPGLMPDSVPSSTAQAEAASAAEQAAAPAAKPAASSQTIAPATAGPTAAKRAAEVPAPAATKPAAAAAAATPATPATPATSTPATAIAPSAIAVPTTTAPASDAKASTQSAEKPAAKPDEQKAQASSGNPLRSFFRSFSQTHSSDAPAKSE